MYSTVEERKERLLMKIDRRKRYILMLDTETCNGIATKNGLDLTQSLVYDLGVAIVDKKGNIYEKESMVIFETFVGMQDVMQSAYYAKKIPMYWDDIKEGKRSLVQWYTARKKVLDLMKKYDCHTVCAHNAGFDHRALNNTQRYLTKSKYRYFFGYATEWWDTLKMARDIFKSKVGYKKFCEANGYMTKHKVPQTRLTAEILYRYLTGNHELVEAHTGLEDVLIETQILTYCLRQHTKYRKRLWE